MLSFVTFSIAGLTRYKLHQQSTTFSNSMWVMLLLILVILGYHTFSSPLLVVVLIFFGIMLMVLWCVWLCNYVYYQDIVFLLYRSVLHYIFVVSIAIDDDQVDYSYCVLTFLPNVWSIAPKKLCKWLYVTLFNDNYLSILILFLRFCCVWFQATCITRWVSHCSGYMSWAGDFHL